MATADQFAINLDIRADKMEKNVNKIVRQAALQIDQLVVTATPVDTGRAASNWLVNLNSPKRAVVDPRGEGAAAKGPTIEEGMGVINSSRPGDEIWISNNVEYINQLNEGTSPQALPNFVQTAMLEAAAAIRSKYHRIFS